MADKHTVDPLAELESLLRVELSVEPSQQFLPRVRDRVRHERQPSPWWKPWLIAPLAAAAAITLVVGGALWQPARTTAPAPEVHASAVTAPPVVSPTPEIRVPRPEPRVPSPEPRDPSPEPRAPSPEPRVPRTEDRTPAAALEVMVDARQRAALLSFIEMARRGQLSEEAFATTTPAPAVIADQVKTIAVEDVAVSPIVAGGVLFFELERK